MPRFRLPVVLAAVAVSAALLPSVRATGIELAEFDFTEDPTTLVLSTFDPGCSIGFGYGKNFVGVGPDAGWSSTGNVFARAVRGATGAAIVARGKNSTNTAADEVVVAKTGSYFSFTVEPHAGKRLALTSVSVKAGSQRIAFEGRRSEAFTAQFFLRSSVDDYATTLASVRGHIPRGDTASSNVWSDLAVDLSKNPAFRNLTAPVTFRVYAYITTPEASWLQIVRVDDFVVKGAVE